MRLTGLECAAAMRGKTATVLFAIGLAGLAGVIAIHARGTSQTPSTDQPLSAEERAGLLAKGKGVFLARCSRCHGENGDKPLRTGVPLSERVTCFQLTELVRRVPKTLEKFSADVLIVTAMPDLYFDEDVRDREARASFEHALEGLANVAPLPLSIAVFSDATSFKTRRRDFFQRLRSQADYVVKVESTPDNKLSFTREKSTPLLPA